MRLEGRERAVTEGMVGMGVVGERGRKFILRQNDPFTYIAKD